MNRYLMVFLFLMPVALSGSEDIPAPEIVLAHAEKLLQAGDYYRSITEFKRFLFFSPDREKAQYAEYQIGNCYLQGRDFIRSSRSFEIMAQSRTHAYRREARLRLADSDIREAGSRARQHRYYDFVPVIFPEKGYRNVLETEEPGSGRYTEAARKLILVHMMNFDLYNATYMFHNPGIDRAEVAGFEKHLVRMKHIPQRSRLTACFLSALVPGTGQIYCGEVQAGFIALAVNAGMAYSAYYTFMNYSRLLGVILAQYELTFYIGNIRNAMLAAEKYNENRKNQFRQELLKLYF